MLWISIVVAVAAFGAIGSVVKMYRNQERDLRLIDPADIIHGG